jgi:hypothetical protein
MRYSCLLGVDLCVIASKVKRRPFFVAHFEENALDAAAAAAVLDIRSRPE